MLTSMIQPFPPDFKGERNRRTGHLYSSRRWRVRAAKGARLESACGGNLTVGSNPTATAMLSNSR
jgi:hypothetical protein